MTTTTEDRIMAGRTHALSALEMIGAMSSEANARAYAAGFITGARAFLLKHYGTRETFALLSNLADDVLLDELPKDAA